MILNHFFGRVFAIKSKSVVSALMAQLRKIFHILLAFARLRSNYTKLRLVVLAKKSQIKKSPEGLFLIWALRGSNSRHLPCKGSALPTELNAHVITCLLIYLIVISVCRALLRKLYLIFVR